MKSIRLMLAGASLLLFCSCGAQVQKETQVANANESKENAVIETIMSRRSIRQYKPQAVNRDTMQIILDCGINAPNGQNKQSWEVRVVDNPDFINGITEIYKKENPKAAEDPKFKNMFRNASTVVFIANDPSYDLSQIDCGLLGENMILSAWSMGIGSCCLGRSHALHDLYSGCCRIPEETGYSGRLSATLLYRFRLSGRNARCQTP